MTGKRIAIVTVHGTGDTAPGPDGEKWFQNGSVFVDRLKARLASHGVEADIVPFLWSGANSARAREDAARKLTKDVKKHAKAHGPVHLLGHSHGGNVANEAARMLRWRPKFDLLTFLLNPLRSLMPRGDRIASVSTVGTPFFRSQLSDAESFGGAAFLLLLIVSTLSLLVLGLALTFEFSDAHRSQDQVYQDAYAAFAIGQLHDPNSGLPVEEAAVRAYADNQYREHISSRPILYFLTTLYIAVIVPLMFIYPIAFSGLARIIRLRRKPNPNATVFSIWHPNDEAIAFLQRVEKLPLEAFPRGAFWRGSRTAGIVWGVRIVNALVLIGLVMAIVGAFGVAFPEPFMAWSLQFSGEVIGAEPTADDAQFWQENFSPLSFGLVLAAFAVVAMPLIFGVVYVFTRLLVFGGVLENGLRGWLNGQVGGVLKGIAFGRDGDERVGEVATQSHCHGAQCVVLEGELAERMQIAAGSAADKLLEKYRWSLFSVGADSNTAIDALATDAMTWNSLIHTTYFDQPEIADMLGDYIAAQERDLAARDAEGLKRLSQYVKSFGRWAPQKLREQAGQE